MENIYYYNTKVIWEYGRVGRLIEKGMPDILVATPPEFTGGVPNIWSPEHLFIASVNICFMTTFLAIVELSKLEFTSFECEGIGKLEKIEGKFMISEIVLKPKVVIKSEEKKDKVIRIIEKSEKNCLISNSIKSNVIIKPEILIKN